MKSFKQFTTENNSKFYEWFSFTVEDYNVRIMFSTKDTSEINEAKHKGTPLGGTYSAQLHPAHSPTGQKHLEVYSKNNKLFALNIDGTAHDQSHGTQIPNRVAQAIKDKFPSFQLPANNFIESAPKAIQLLFRTGRAHENIT